MTLRTVVILLTAQMLFWVALWLLVAWFDHWRRRRAEARGVRPPGHFNELVLVLSVISTLSVVWAFVVTWVRPP